MNRGEIKIILAILELFLEVGVPTAIEAIKNFNLSNEPTPEEIRSLSDKLKAADRYWNAE